MSYDLRVIALGAGVQSSTLYLLASAGELGPKPDVAIFADTQAEPPWVYEQLDYLGRVGTIPIRRVTAGSIIDSVYAAIDHGARFASIPFWVGSKNWKRGKAKRHCTHDFKIEPIKQEIRRTLGVAKGKRAAGKYRVEEWVGISIDEAHRAKPSRESWITTRWPLLFDRPMRRHDCLRWLEANGHPIPKKSACWFCPFRSDAAWADIRDNAPDLFEQAIDMDDSIRVKLPRGLKNAPYLHDSLTPLRDVDLDPNRDQPDLFGNECEGMCGV